MRLVFPADNTSMAPVLGDLKFEPRMLASSGPSARSTKKYMSGVASMVPLCVYTPGAGLGFAPINPSSSGIDSRYLVLGAVVFRLSLVF